MLALLLVTALGPAFAVYALNRAIDPLWYGEGNRLFAENFPYNERFSKANRFLRSASDYDCVVLGSSRTTLLDAEKIEGHRCFNFAVSNGNIEEYADILRFVSARTELSLVVLGVDAFNFTDHGLGRSLPGFMLQTDGEPVPSLEAYLSLDVLDFSLRALVSRDQRTRFYDPSFTGDVMPARRAFEAPAALDPAHPHGGLAKSRTNASGPFLPGTAKGLWDEMRAAHPGARFVGYVPPLAAHFLAHVEARGELDRYLASLWNASRGLDALYDFTFPSAFSANLENTYDGSHFFRAANDRVARVLSSGSDAGGIALPVHALEEQVYRSRFAEALRDFRRRVYPE